MLNSHQKAWLRAGSVFVAAVWVMLGVANGWPVWVWLVLAAVTLLLPPLIRIAVTEVVLLRRPKQPLYQETLVEPEPPEPDPPQTESLAVKDVLLPSARDDYHFTFSCTVSWSPREHGLTIQHSNPGTLAADVIIDRATKLAAAFQPDDVSRARYHLMSELGAPTRDRTGSVLAWAEQVSLDVAEEDAQRLKRLADVRKEEEVWEHERKYERNVRAYLGEDALKTPGSALVWWLAEPRTEEKQRVGEAVRQIETLQRLARAAGATDSESELVFTGFAQCGPDQTELSPGASAVKFLETLPDTPERAYLARKVADFFWARNCPEDAEIVISRFDAPAPVNAKEQTPQGELTSADGATADRTASRADDAEEHEASEVSPGGDDTDPGSVEAGLGA